MARNESLSQGRIAHACLISAPDMSAAVAKARQLAAAAICEAEGQRPCGLCRHCRKASAGIHPDIINIERLADDKGKKKKQISVEQIRAMSADAYMLPNEAGRKVYIIHEAETMNPSAQNAALKLLEEPPHGAIFLLCCVNSLQLLPTVRSRCSEINLGGSVQEQPKEESGLAAEYIKTVSAGDEAQLLRWCWKNEGMDNAAAMEFVLECKELISDMLCGREKSRGLSASELMELVSLMDKCIAYLRLNVGVKHIFGLLAVESIAGSGNRG